VVNRVYWSILVFVLVLTLGGVTPIAAARHDVHPGMQNTPPPSTPPMPMMSMVTPEWDGQSPFDKWFLDNMIPHHQQAIMMSRMLVMHSQRAEMKTLGNDIINAQLQEIDQMQSWRSQWFATQPLATHPGMMQEMSGVMRMEHGGMMMPGHTPGMMMKMDVDLWFINNMIPHHQGAIDMANAALKNSQRQEILDLAQSIISAQQKEIDMMKQWKSAWYPDTK